MEHESREIPSAEWRDFFDTLTKDFEGDDVTIEVVDDDLGDQFEAEGLPLAFSEYDPKDDVVIIALGGGDGSDPIVLRRIIEHPKRVLADPTVPNVDYALDIVDADGAQTIVTLQHRPAG